MPKKMFALVIATLLLIVGMPTAVTVNAVEDVAVEATTQRDPFGDIGAAPELGDMFQFDQNTTVSTISGEEIEVTPNDVCYMVSGPSARGQCRIYIEGMDPSIKVYTRFWMDTEFTVIKSDVLFIGDINADARIDSFDMVFARKLLIASIKGEIDDISVVRADMNEDGNFSVSDLVALQRFLLNDKEI